MVCPITYGGHNKSKHSLGTEIYYDAKESEKLKPGLVTSYSLWPGNGAGPILQLPGNTEQNTIQLECGQLP